MARWSSGLRLRPLTPATRVRISYGSPFFKKWILWYKSGQPVLYSDGANAVAAKLVPMAVRVHLFPFRTQKLSSPVPKILGWKRPGKIGRCQHKEAWKMYIPSGTVHFSPFLTSPHNLFTLHYYFLLQTYSSLAQSVERAAVNRVVVGSSPTGGAIIITFQIWTIRVRLEGDFSL